MIDLLFSLFAGEYAFPETVVFLDKVIYVTCITVLLKIIVPFCWTISKKIKGALRLW